MHTLRSYIIGFILSLALTLAAPALFLWHLSTGHVFPTHQELRFSFVILAIAQLAVQLIFFLHINRQKEGRWNLAALAFALIVVGILVSGTLWIMYNLQAGQDTQMGTFINGEVTPQMEDD